MDSTEHDHVNYLIQTTRMSLAGNLVGMLQVAATNEDNEHIGKSSTKSSVKKLKLTELKAKTSIARSTLTKLVQGKTGKVASNPDLNTLCRLAAMLKVPPAFLLMTPEDWTRLFRAIDGLELFLDGQGNFEKLEKQLDEAKTSTDKVLVGLNLTKKISHYPIQQHFNLDEASDKMTEIKADIQNRNESMSRAILNTTALLQRSLSLKKDITTATVISAFFGSSIK
jgi:transcriptional regulator with XRE-family HTH domain